MKKHYFLLFLISLLFVLSGCTADRINIPLEDRESEEIFEEEVIPKEVIPKEEIEEFYEAEQEVIDEKGPEFIPEKEEWKAEELADEKKVVRRGGVTIVKPVPNTFYLNGVRTDQKYYNLYSGRVEIKGTNSADASEIRVKFTNEEVGLTDDYKLTKFKEGDTEWAYVADVRYKNLADGVNRYIVEVYEMKEGEMVKFDEKEINIIASIPPDAAEVPEGNKITVNFFSAPQAVDPGDYLSSIGLYRKAINAIGSDLENHFKFHKLGKVRSGFYEGSTLMMMSMPSICGMGCPAYRVLQKPDSTFVVLEKHSTSGWMSTGDKIKNLLGVTIDEETEIENLFPPESISIPDSSYKLVRRGEYTTMMGFKFFDDLEKEKLFFSNELRQNVYDWNHCIIIRNEDGTFSEYVIDFDFLNEYVDDSARPFLIGRRGKININWNDGTKSGSDYSALRMTGCGLACYDVLEKENGVYKMDDFELGELVAVGKTDTGNEVYMEEYTEEAIKEMSSSKDGKPGRYLESVYYNYHSKDNLSLTSFFKSNPIIYIKDPFDRFIKFTKQDYVPMAECAKPVIYLYPEVTADISVEVEPTGGFTKTEPAYNDGWFVEATPESEILNYDDGKSYPYLFWEGEAIDYEMSDEGFVVEKGEVESFLKDKLAVQGMNKKEIADFMEFWLPRMQEKPYYFITFVPQYQFDQMAPLTVKPQPDTIIRVFMDFKGLNEKIDVKPQELRAPERKGFTVIEWGGELRD